MKSDRRRGDERRLQPRSDALPATPRERRDLVGICAIEIGISLQERLGTRAAAAYLHRQKIHLETALRVLLQPAKRRRYGA